MMSSHHLGSGCVRFALFLVGMIATAQGQSEPTLATLRSGARPLVVGGISEYTPFNVVGPDGQLTGMDREIVRAAAKRLGVKQVEFKTMAFSKLGQSLLDGKIDLIANNYWLTPDRERASGFTPSPCRTSCAVGWAHCGLRGPARSTPRPVWPGSVSPS
jgi:ABC-type amino acid transport substrate-binding protein